MTDPRFLIRSITVALSRYRYHFGSEKRLHEGMAQALNSAGIGYVREFQIDEKNRFDFWCGDSVVIEAKIHGSQSDALLQANRYCELPTVKAIVVAATRLWCRNKELELHGKPVVFVRLQAQAY